MGDVNNNQINLAGKVTAGLLLTFLTTLAIYLLIAFWPNKMPAIKDGDDGAWYTCKRFGVTLIEKPDKQIEHENDSLGGLLDSMEKRILVFNDSIKTKKDSVKLGQFKDSVKSLDAKIVKLQSKVVDIGAIERIHLNTILLLLVALMGFLGNMIHVASSFTTFVGMGAFQRNWVLWYFVKPFTAAALAIIIYFIIRAGFLSYGSGASSVSLYGIMALSALAGLFTDSATLKLKEVFEVIFKTKDDRTGKLSGDELSVLSITPDPIPATGETTLTITGKNLNMPGLKITINDSPVTPLVNTGEKIELKFIPAADIKKASLVLADKTDKALYAKELKVKQ